MSILTSYDIQMMNCDVRDIIIGWNTTVTILRPKPLAQQTNYNSLAREYTGSIIVDTISNVPAERKDITNYLLTNLRGDLAGLVSDGDQVYAIPLKYMVDGVLTDIIIQTTDIFILPDRSGDKFMVKAIKNRIGEQLVVLNPYMGGTISGW